VERVLRLLAFGIAAVFAQSTVVTLLPFRDHLPELVLPAVLFLATAEIEVAWGAALCLVIGYLFDLLSGIPIGMHSLTLQIVYLAGRWIQRRFFLAGVLFEAALTLGAVWFEAAVVAATLVAARGRGLEGLGPAALATLVRSVLTALLAPAVFWAGGRATAGRKPTLATGPPPPARPSPGA
jgi:rod shape-determining protein MreD